MLEQPTLLDALLVAGADLETYGSDALVSAASAGRIATASRLLERGVPLDAAGTIEVSPVRAAAEGGELAMLRFLLGRGARPVPPDSIRLAEDRGYVVVLDVEARRRFEQTVSELAERPASHAARRRRDELVARLHREERSFGPWTGSESAEVSQISAAVYGHDGHPVAAIGVHAQPHQIDPSRISEHATSVLEAADRVTARIHGRNPAMSVRQPNRSAISS